MNFHLQLDSEAVGHLDSSEPLTVAPGTTVREAIAKMQEKPTGSLLVCEGSALLGIFTERDVLRIVASGQSLDAPIEEHMIPNPVTVTAEDTVGKAIQHMAQGGYRRLPIVDKDGATNGMVKVSHILRHLVDHFPEAVYNLPPSPNPTTQAREGA